MASVQIPLVPAITNQLRRIVRKIWPKHLSVQLIMLVTLLTAGAIFTFTYRAAEKESNRIAQHMRLQAQVLASNLAATGADLLLVRDYTAIENLLLRSARFPGILAIHICDETGKIVGQVVRGQDNELIPRYGDAPLSTPDSNKSQLIFTDKEMFVWHPLILGELLGWTKITYSLQDITDAKQRLWRDNTYNGIIILLVTGGLLILFLRRPMASIAKYTNFADRLDESHGEHVPVDTHSLELSKLGSALNRASTRLYQQSLAIKKAVSELERLAAFPENDTNIVLSINKNGEVEYLNPQGHSALEKMGVGANAITELLPIHSEILLKNCLKEQRTLREIEVSYGDYTFLWTFAPIAAQNMLHGYAMDITERKKAEKKAQSALIEKLSAESANKAKSQFLANMSHELRTPLNAIIGYSEILAEDALEDDNKAILPDLDRITSAGKHLLALINEILDLSKIEAGKMELFLEQTSLTTILNDIVSTVTPLAEKNGNVINARFDDNLGTIFTDVTKLRQVSLNLLSNACKFTEHGQINLTVTRNEQDGTDWITLIVNDSGIGMASQQVKRIFEPFLQADSSTTRKYGGTGLGLAISKHFCSMMGGEIGVSSEPGKGSTFTIRLPAIISHQQANDYLENQPKQSASPARKIIDPKEKRFKGEQHGKTDRRKNISRVLVIDDDPSVRELAIRHLSKEGFNVQTAANGLKGLELAKEFNPDVITLDVMMPEMDGWSVLKSLKEDPDLANVPVTMLTMLDEQGIGYSLGAKDYLLKPVDWGKLADTIKRCVRAKRKGNILVVENEEHIRDLVRQILEETNYSVTEAENGLEAMKRIQNQTPDLIVLDLIMPEMNGYEFVTALRNEPQYDSIPVIIVSEMSLDREQRQWLQSHVQRVLYKGAIYSGTLLREIHSLLSHSQLVEV